MDILLVSVPSDELGQKLGVFPPLLIDGDENSYPTKIIHYAVFQYMSLALCI